MRKNIPLWATIYFKSKRFVKKPLKIIIYLSAPIVFTILFLYLLPSYITKPLRDFITDRLTNDPSRALHRQYIFWLALVVPLSLFLLVGSLYWKGYYFSWTKEGIDTFFEISKIPLYFLGSTIPLLVLAARIHGTRQTETQIKVTQQTNSFTNYYKHRELFSEFIDEHFDKTVYIIDKNILYKKLYPNNNDRYFNTDSNVFYLKRSLSENYLLFINSSIEEISKTGTLKQPPKVLVDEFKNGYAGIRIIALENELTLHIHDYFPLIFDSFRKLSEFTHELFIVDPLLSSPDFQSKVQKVISAIDKIQEQENTDRLNELGIDLDKVF